MATVLLIIELIVTLALIGIVLIQRSEGGGLGIGGSQGMGSFMSGRGTTNLLTRTTAILAALFMGLALLLALVGHGGSGTSILNAPPPAHPAASLPAPRVGGPSAPGAPAAPTGTGVPAVPVAPSVPTK